MEERVTKSFKTWWHRFLFRDRGVLPTPRFIWLFLLMSIPISIASFWNKGWIAFFLLNSILFLASIFDLSILPRRSQLTATRLLADEVERDEIFLVNLSITNTSAFSITFRLIDDLPISFVRPFPMNGSLNDGETTTVSYYSKAEIRGDYSLEKIHFRYQSVLGLWEKQTAFCPYHKLRVIPNMKQVKAYLTAPQQLLQHEGVKVKRAGIGNGEFAQIRPYVVGDDPRKINWHQTAKLTELMTNVYDPEHGKHITLLIDCGRIMGVELTEGNRLEKSFEAALTVAAAALQQGDYVSVMAFSNQVKTYIPPGKGLTHLKTIIRGIYNLHSDPIESNYAVAFNHLETVQKRRSFILLFSDLDSFLFEEHSLHYMEQLRRRHYFLLLGITNPMVSQWIQAEANDTRLSMIKSIAQRETMRRKREIRRLGHMGLSMVEVPEEQLAAEALNRYFEIINRGVL